MDRLFLDANVLFSAAYRPDAGLLQFWKLSGVLLCSSRYALEEARINSTEGAQRRLSRLARSIQFFDAPPPQSLPAISLPEKDWPIFLAALDARATHLITGDIRHFGRYLGKVIQGILIVTPASYLKIRWRSR
jgi:uncharacterized protein